MVFPRLEDPGFARAFAGVCAIVTAVAVGAAALVYLFRLVLLVLLACVLAELFITIADPLARRLPGPRGIYVAFALLLVLSAFAGLVTLLVVPLTDQAGHLADELPRLVARVERFVDGNVVQPSSPARDSMQEAVTERLPAFAVSGLTGAASILEGAFDVLGAVFFAFFLALTPEAHREGLLSLAPARLAPRLDAFITIARDSLRAWLSAVGIGMPIVFALATGGLYIIGVDGWLVFGAFSAGMELVPYAGPFLGFLGPFLQEILDGEPKHAVLVLVLYVAIQALMLNVIGPYLVKRRTHIPASLALASLLLLGRACGAIGILAAVPFVAILLAAFKTVTPPAVRPVAA